MDDSEEIFLLKDIKNKIEKLFINIYSIENNKKRKKFFESKKRIRTISLELEKLFLKYRKISMKNQKEYYKKRNNML